MRRGTRLGVDVGTVRIGIARTDADALLATPVETVPRDKHGDRDIARIRELVAEVGAVEVLVGLPVALSGNETASTADARAVAGRLAAALGGDPAVRLVDERLSSVTANAAMRESGRSSRRARPVIDQAAAVVLLQQAVDVERGTGRPPGTVVDVPVVPAEPQTRPSEGDSA